MFNLFKKLESKKSGKTEAVGAVIEIPIPDKETLKKRIQEELDSVNDEYEKRIGVYELHKKHNTKNEAELIEERVKANLYRNSRTMEIYHKYDPLMAKLIEKEQKQKLETEKAAVYNLQKAEVKKEDPRAWLDGTMKTKLKAKGVPYSEINKKTFTEQMALDIINGKPEEKIPTPPVTPKEEAVDVEIPAAPIIEKIEENTPTETTQEPEVVIENTATVEVEPQNPTTENVSLEKVNKKEGIEVAPTENIEQTKVVVIKKDITDVDFTDTEKIDNVRQNIEISFAQREYENTPEEDKQKIAFGLNTLGFFVEQKKNNFFAATFNKIAEKLPEGKTTSRFCKELAATFTRDSESAFKKAESVTSGKEKHGLANASLGFGNVLRYGRIVSDLVGWTAGTSMRYVMMSAMAVTRASEAAKETHLTNEEVIEKTRINDANLAAEEAWKIYESAQKKEGGTDVSADALKKAYLLEMPADLKKRLENTEIADGFFQLFIRRKLEHDIYNLNEKLDEIENDTKLSGEEKENKKNNLIKKQERKLVDYDRMLTQTGTVDGLAMAGRFAQTTGKVVVAAATIETLYISAEKLFGALSNVISDHAASIPTDTGLIRSVEESLKAKPGVLPIEHDTTTIAHDTTSVKIAHPDSTTVSHDTTEVKVAYGDSTGAKSVIDSTQNKPGVLPAEHDTATAHDSTHVKVEQPSSPTEKIAEKVAAHINPDAIVHKGQGIEHAFIKQIEHNPILAKELAEKAGFKGDLNNPKILHEFAGKQAHLIAINEGYVDSTTGHQVSVLQADKVGYEIKMENGHIAVDEKSVDGKLFETHHEGDKFETKIEKYEYSDGKDHRVIEHLIKEQPATHAVENVETDIRPIKPEGLQMTDISHQGDLSTHINTENLTAGSVATHHEGIALVDINGRQFTEAEWMKSPLNPFGIKADVANRVAEMHNNNIDHLYNDPSLTDFTREHLNNTLKTGDASTILHEEVKEIYNPLQNQLHKLHDVTGLEPKEGNAFQPAETNEEYIYRAEMKAASMGKLDEVKFHEMTTAPHSATTAPIEHSTPSTTHPEIKTETSKIFPDEKEHVQDIISKNKASIFPKDTKSNWERNEILSANDVINLKKPGVLTGLSAYLHKLEEVTGLKPFKVGEGTAIKTAENVHDYINRAIKSIPSKDIENIRIAK